MRANSSLKISTAMTCHYRSNAGLPHDNDPFCTRRSVWISELMFEFSRRFQSSAGV
jgi:hypothetical protein